MTCAFGQLFGWINWSGSSIIFYCTFLLSHDPGFAIVCNVFFLTCMCTLGDNCGEKKQKFAVTGGVAWALGSAHKKSK